MEVLPAAFTLAQRALAAAAILARPAALMVRFFLPAGLTATFAAGLPALILAQRAFCAARILAMPAALGPFLPDLPDLATTAFAEAGAEPPRMPASFFSSTVIWSFNRAAWFNWDEVRDNKLLIGG